MISKRTLGMVVLLGAGLAGAAEDATLVVSTGPRTLLPQHVALVSLSDVATRGAGSARVRLALLDAQDRVVAEIAGSVQRGRPLLLRLPASTQTQHLRAVAHVERPGDPDLGLRWPTLSYETWDPSTIDDLAIEQCRLPGPDLDPPPKGAQGCCGVCHCDIEPLEP